jgi:hypothetical protein
MAKTSVKIDTIEKEKLEILQAKLRLEKNLSLDQYEIIGKLINYALENFNDLNFSSNDVLKLTEDEIRELENEVIISAKEFDVDKTDDELIYGI